MMFKELLTMHDGRRTRGSPKKPPFSMLCSGELKTHKRLAMLSNILLVDIDKKLLQYKRVKNIFFNLFTISWQYTKGEPEEERVEIEGTDHDQTAENVSLIMDQ